MQIYVDHTGQVHFNATSLKRGDDLEFQLSFLNEKGLAVSCPYSSIKFGAKKTTDYDGGFLVYLDSWSDSGNVKVGKVALNGTALAELLGSGEYVLIAGEFEFATTEQKVTSQTVKLKIYNDLIKGAEGIPSGTIPNYATEEYINGVVTEKVADEMDSREDVLSGLVATATEKASEAKASAGTASEKAVNANASALTAQESASSASESLATVRALKSSVEGVSVKVAQNVALAAQKAENAATSAAEALASKNAAQNVADSLGGEVAEAKQSAVEAKASATSAATSAATAKTEVGKIGNSVAESQTAASQALASANTASGHATTAGTKATQAATSATNASSSESKAKASETAAGTSATNAANSATTASGHASTASAKATQAGTSATAASASATQAAGSASAAQGSASTATTKATEAAGRATAAADYANLAGKARDAAVTAKTAAEAAADRAEAAEGGITQGEFNAAMSEHNTAAVSHDDAFSKKLDKPPGGTTGQFLVKTKDGEEWSDAPPSGVTQAQVDTSISTHDASMFAHKDAIDLVRYQFGMRIDDLWTDLKLYVTDAILAAAPVGSIFMHWSTVLPDGFLLCNGGLVSKATYSNLYASRPTTGPGWGENGNKFYLPDFGARYPRGTNNGNVGIYLEDAIRNIYGTIAKHGGEKGSDIYQPTGAFGGIVLDKFVPNADNPRATNSTSMPEVSFDASRVVPTAEENRPRTTVVNFIIKY